MLTSIPKTAAEIGLTPEDYSVLAKNLRRIALLSNQAKEKILERANVELPKELTAKACLLIEDMKNETREFYRLAGFNYALGPCGKQNVFEPSVADYLLRNRDKFNNCTRC